MKIQKHISIGLFCITMLLFVLPATAQHTLKGNGNVVKEARAISSFNELSIKGVYKVYLEQGNKEAVVVETDENLQEVITVKNKGETLILGWKKGINIKKKTKMNVYVTLKDITKLEIKGVGDVKTSSQLSLQKLDLEVSGVGNTFLNLECKKLNGDIAMVGNLTLQGKVAEVTLDNNGTGALRAFDLIAQKLAINNSGIGRVEVMAEEEISIVSSGIGSVRYKGNAKTTQLDHRGMGKIKKVD